VTHYGQTPSQLLVKEHPKRYAKEDCILPLCYEQSNLNNIRCYPSPLKQIGEAAVIAISCNGERLIVCHANLTLSFYRWNSFPEDDMHPFSYRAEKNKDIPSASLSTSEEILRSRSNIFQTTAPPMFTETVSGPSSSSSFIESSSLFGAIRNSLTRNSLSTNVSPASKVTKDALEELFPQTLRVKAAAAAASLDEGGNRVTGSDQSSTPYGNSCVCHSLSHMKVALNASDAGAVRIISCSYWDHALKIHSVETLREVASCTSGHKGEIKCVQQGSGNDSNTLITGGADGTCRVWVFEKSSLAAAYSSDPFHIDFGDDDPYLQSQDQSILNNMSNALVCVHTLCGHQSPVLSISYSSTLDLVLSGGANGLLCIHSVRNGQYIRSIRCPSCPSADLVVLSHSGYFVVHSWSDNRMHVLWVNGQHLLSRDLTYR